MGQKCFDFIVAPVDLTNNWRTLAKAFQMLAWFQRAFHVAQRISSSYSDSDFYLH